MPSIHFFSTYLSMLCYSKFTSSVNHDADNKKFKKEQIQRATIIWSKLSPLPNNASIHAVRLKVIVGLKKFR